MEKYLSTAKVSESFQRYINDGLEEVEQRMQAGENGEPAPDPGVCLRRQASGWRLAGSASAAVAWWLVCLLT